MKNYFIYILFICIIFSSCKRLPPDELFYKKAELLDIKRDDDSQYHLLVKYSDGSVESLADVKCSIKMGEYNPSAGMPFVKWENYNTNGVMEGWRANSTDYSHVPIKIYLPVNYQIPLIND